MKYPSAEYDALVEGFRRKLMDQGEVSSKSQVKRIMVQSEPKRRGRPKGSKNRPKEKA